MTEEMLALIALYAVFPKWEHDGTHYKEGCPTCEALRVARSLIERRAAQPEPRQK